MISRIFERLGLSAEQEIPERSLEVATAALLVQVSLADGSISPEERKALDVCLKDHFSLSSEEVAVLIERGERDQADAACLYAFTRAIAKELDNEERQDIVRLLWRVAYADGNLDNFEANVIAKVSGLLGVSPSDRVRLKQEVAAA